MSVVLGILLRYMDLAHARQYSESFRFTFAYSFFQTKQDIKLFKKKLLMELIARGTSRLSNK